MLWHFQLLQIEIFENDADVNVKSCHIRGKTLKAKRYFKSRNICKVAPKSNQVQQDSYEPQQNSSIHINSSIIRLTIHISQFNQRQF